MNIDPTSPLLHCYGTLSDTGIKLARSQGLVVISPFKESNLGPNSYDVSLGEFFYREQHPTTKSPVYNLYSKDSIDRIWGADPELAPTYAQLIKDKYLPENMENVNFYDRVVLLGPGETVLGHTMEFIGGTVADDGIGVTTKMHARSSIGRSMIGVCKCAGLGDAGYINRWTMEITNFSRFHWIPLIVGRRIAQIEFQMLQYVANAYKGKYQSELTLDKLRESWKPEMMLPRLHKDLST